MRTKGHFVIGGGEKIPMPMLSEREILAKEKAIMRNPGAWIGTPEQKKRNEVFF